MTLSPEQRHLLDFIQRRGGTVTVRSVMQSYAPIKNQRIEAEAALNALSAIDYGNGDSSARRKRAGGQRYFSNYCLIYETVASKSIRAAHDPKQNKAPHRKALPAIIYALTNHESVESIRKYHKSRHTVLAIREQYSHEIETTQARIKGGNRGALL
jgi:hypothetical protein